MKIFYMPYVILDCFLSFGRVIVLSAPLLKPYAIDPVKPICTSADEILIIRACSRRRGNACWVKKNGALISQSRSNRSSYRNL